MSNLTVKLLLQAVDRMSAPIIGARNKVIGAFRGMQASAQGLGEAVGFRMKYYFYAFPIEARKVGAAAIELGEKIKRVGNQAKEAGEFFMKRLTLPIVGFGALAIRQAGNIEALTNRFKALAGGAKQAGDLVSQLRSLSDKSTLDFSDISEAAQQMMALGYSTDSTMKRLNFLAPIAAGSGMQMQELVQQYISVRKAAKVSADDIMSLAGKGVPILPVLAKQLGVSEKRVLQLAEAGRISFAKYKTALQGMSAEGGAYADSLEENANSINGVFKNLKNSLGSAFADIGKDLFKDLDIGGKVKTLTQAIRDFANWFKALPAPMKNFITWAALIVAVLGPLVFVLGQVVMGVGMLITGFGALATALSFIPAILAGIVAFFVGPWALIAVAVAGVVAAVYGLVKAIIALFTNWESVCTFIVDSWDGIKKAFGSAADYIMGKLEPLIALMDRLNQGWQSIKGFATDNAVTRAAGRLFGSDSAASAQGAPVGGAVGVAPGRTAQGQKMDTGGTLNIKIDTTTGRAVDVTARPNDGRQSMNVETGTLMAGGY